MFTPPPHLDVYYASTCAPCRVELPVLLQAIKHGTEVRILIVSDPRAADADLIAVDPTLAMSAHMAEGDTPRDRLRRASDSDSILPFARSVDGKGRICASWRGMLTLSRIRQLLSRCG